MLILKLSLLRSTLRQVPLGPCLPTAKRLSRAGVPAASPSGVPGLRDSGARALRDSGAPGLRGAGTPARWHCGTCPPLASKHGHNPSMPFPRCQEWTCSVRLDAKSEHVRRIGHLERTCSALRAVTAGQNLHYRERPLDMSLGGGREHWTCPARPRAIAGSCRAATPGTQRAEARSGRSGATAGSPKEPAVEPNTPTPKLCHMFDKIVTRRSGPQRSSSVLWNP